MLVNEAVVFAVIAARIGPYHEVVARRDHSVKNEWGQWPARAVGSQCLPKRLPAAGVIERFIDLELVSWHSADFFYHPIMLFEAFLQEDLGTLFDKDHIVALADGT